MPKQPLKIVHFHGGLSSDPDQRDIADNELSSATDVMVDKIGVLRMMGGNATHDAPANAAAITAGYGLFQFSHDRTGGNLATEHLSNTGDFSSNWSRTGDMAVDSTDATYTHSSGAGTLIQAAANRAVEGIANTKYAFTYTISGFAETISLFQILGTGSQFAAATTNLEQSDGTHTTTFTSHATDPDQPFTINVTSSTSGAFNIDNVSLYIVDETGDDYLVMADTGGAANLDIYSKNTDAWGTEIIDLGSDTGMKPTFYASSGALRVCDGNFENSNTNKWYGYIDRPHFAGTYVDTYNGWFSKDQAIASPTYGILGTYNGPLAGISRTTNSSATILSTDPGMDTFSSVTNDEIDGHIVLNLTEAKALEVISRTDESRIVTDAATQWNNADIWMLFPPAGLGFNVFITFAEGTSSWEDKTYSLASTFIYDGIQESLPFTLVNTFTITSPDDVPTFNVWATSPYNPRLTGGRIYYREAESSDNWLLLIDIDFRDGTRTGIYDDYIAWTLPTVVETRWENWGNEWEDEDRDWEDCASPVLHNDLKNEYLQGQHTITEPDLINIYEVLSGLSQDAHSLEAKYQTAVIANNSTYIGNIQTKNEDNETEVFGDMMIRSPSGKYDTFPFERRSAVSIRDGDKIVKLEAYADRILQFKKTKLHLINVAQEIEFPEDTFMHKGVLHPAAVCKTDFGIAWVNNLGCYLYDGQRVSNLLEKEGRQIIKKSTWEGFITDNSIIGYIPKKRQLIVLKDCTATSVGDIYIYDLVTRSWVEGDSKFVDGVKQTNFVTDWNGDLVHAYNSGTGTVGKWDDASDTSTTFECITKDFDFGEPAMKKRIYKVYITYKSSGGSNVDVDYSTNGDHDTFTEISDGLADTSNEWSTVALSVTPSDVYSFMLRFQADGTVPTSFEINDISIIFRVKSVR